MSFRGDIKTIHGNKEGAFDFVVGFSVGYTFGNDVATVPRVAVSTPPPPAPIVEMAEGDEDQDGVADSRDSCPGTDAGLAVDDNGCPILEASQLRQELLINVEFDRAEIRPEYLGEVANFAEFMRRVMG